MGKAETLLQGDMNLKAAVERYLESVGSFGVPMPLDRFGLTQAEVEAMLAAWEDDYHLSRHFELVPSSQASVPAPAYSINGAVYSAIIFRESIRDVLG